MQKLLRSPSAFLAPQSAAVPGLLPASSRARASLAYLPDMSRDALRGVAHLGLLATLLQSFLGTLQQNCRFA